MNLQLSAILPNHHHQFWSLVCDVIGGFYESAKRPKGESEEVILVIAPIFFR
jgi:hypothetical protein